LSEGVLLLLVVSQVAVPRPAGVLRVGAFLSPAAEPFRGALLAPGLVLRIAVHLVSSALLQREHVLQARYGKELLASSQPVSDE
jgi:hypothetical protein